ncbi:MAG: sulfite exporter TauE/SafE family protein [Planctomycetota bacterium]
MLNAVQDSLVQGLAFGVASSLHCIGMCGPWAGFAGAGRSAVVLFQSGRVFGYLTLGGLAGAFGQGLAGSVGMPADLSRGAAIAAIVFGVVLLARGVFGPKVLPFGGSLGGFGQRAMRGVFSLSPTSRALALGVLTGLLPCGVLYAAFLAAASTTSPVLGATSLVGLALGAAPALVLAQWPAARFIRKPTVARVFAIVAGLTLVFRAVMTWDTGEPSCCH